jgi:hypothetical protein
MEDTQPAKSKEGNYGVILPCAPEDFGEFVSNLLGKPQTIERQIYGAFEIRKEDIFNTHHLVNQEPMAEPFGEQPARLRI